MNTTMETTKSARPSAHLRTVSFVRDPWTLLRYMQEPADTATTTSRPERQPAWTPAMEVFRRENELVLHAGERKQPHENTGDAFYRTERRYGYFQRSLPLPEEVSGEQISASFSDGVLEVRVPLPAPTAARKIKIS